MTPNMRETMQWLRDQGFMVKGQPTMNAEGHTFSLDERDTISRAFSAGNYANAYESTDLDDFDLDDLSDVIEDLKPEHNAIARVAFVLGFFGSYSLDEIGDREIFDECYFSACGTYVVYVAKYCDSRADEYSAEESEI